MRRYSFNFSDKQEAFAESMLDESIFESHKELYLHLLEKLNDEPSYVKQRRKELEWRKKVKKNTSSDVETIYRKLESFILPVGFDLPDSTYASTYEGLDTLPVEWTDNDVTFPLEEPMFIINCGLANKNFFYPIKMANFVEPQMLDLHKISIKSNKYTNSLEGQAFNQEYWMWRVFKDASLSIEDAMRQFGSTSNRA